MRRWSNKKKHSLKLFHKLFSRVKQEYIKLKHLNCTYALRENTVDGPLCVENELGKELHASVRSPNLETSFRLLTRGANPNYFHDVRIH